MYSYLLAVRHFVTVNRSVLRVSTYAPAERTLPKMGYWVWLGSYQLFAFIRTFN